MRLPGQLSRACLCAVLAELALIPGPVRGEYHYFSNVASGSDAIVQEVRWPYWNSAYYNTWLSDNWTSSEGVGGYFYSGLALPSASSPNPVGTKQTVNWSFWPLSNPVNISDTIGSYMTSPTTFAMQTIGEGTILRSPGAWTLWQTNVWYRMAFRSWQPVNGTPHLGYAGIWFRDPVAAVWYHQATVQLPFAITGIDGLMGFQENAVGGSGPQRTDYRGCYYHKNGVWNSGNQFYVYNHGGGIENVGLIEANTAVYYETCKSNGVYTGSITNVGQSSPTFTITQAATPTFDPIIVSNVAASVSGNQLLVQWQTIPASSPQFAYQIDVYTNAGYSGNVVASAYDIAPDAQQKLLTVGTSATLYPRLTIIDIFSQTNAPINLAPTNASLVVAVGAPNVVSGLNYSYYQSASNYTLDSNTNWASMPNFGSLTPVSVGAVNGLDLSPRQRRNGYAFNYTGYLSVPSNGLYAFTLNSDAGSKLYVDGQLVVNNDGLHSPADASGWIGLQAGNHTLNVQYFCDTQSALFGASYYFDTLSLAYEGPGIAKTAVPASAFFRTPVASEPSVTLAGPTNAATLSGASVPLSATVTANGNTINKVQFYCGNNYWAQDAAAPYSMNSFFWANANNPLRVRLFYNTTNVIDSAVNLVTTTNMNLAPWQFGQIFYHNQPSGASIQSGTYSVIGDGVNLLTRQLSGDCTLIAHLAALPSTAAAPDGSAANTGWQAGIILRGTTNMTPGYPWGKTTTAPFTAVFSQVGGGTYFQDETMVNGGGGYASANLGSQKWYKIQRVGNVFTSSVSADGNTWTAVNTNTLTDFGTTLYAGFFTYAGPSSNPNVHFASFDNLGLTGNLVGPPGVSINPQSDTAYTGQTVTFTAVPSGNAPFAYQWQSNNVNLAGATNVALVLANVAPAYSGVYGVTLSNANGTASSTANLTVLSPPPGTTQVLSNNPVAYWRLNEAAGPTAYDSAGSFNGTGEGGIVFGVSGVGSPFTGFESSNLAAQFNGTDSDVAVPALNLNTNALTITGWVKRNGAQTAWSGLLFCRAGTTASGLHFGTANELRYTWNNSSGTYNWNSTLTVPDGVWTFVALVIQPSQAIMYMATNSTLYSATNVVANAVQAFAGTTYLGYDPNSSARRLNGVLDEVAIFNQSLTAAQLGQILTASRAATPPSVNLTAPATGASYGSPATINLAASVTTNGHAISQVQFYNGSTLLGQSSTPPYAYTWTNVLAGSYTVLAQVSYDSGASTWSSPAFVTVSPIPLAPATITPSALANNLVGLTWPASANATGYILSRGGSPIAYLSGTNYLDLGLVPNNSYCYSVIATNAFGSSGSSVTNCATTPGSGAALAWDAGGATAGAQDGNGNWGSGGANWWNGSANVVWANSSLALFGAGTTTNCSLTITNDVSPSGILFNANNGGSYNISSSSGALNLSGTPSIVGNNDATISAYLKGSGTLMKSGPGTLTLSVANTNTGAVIVNGGKLVGTVSCWYSPRSIGSGLLTVSNGALAQFTATHGFGADAGGRSATLNNGTLQFDHENYVNGLTMTAGTISGGGEFRTIGGATYTVNASVNPSVLASTINFVGAPTFNVADGSGSVDLLVSGNAYGTAGFTKSGAGLMRCTGSFTNSGTTTVTGGALQVDGSFGSNTVAVTVQSTAAIAGVGIMNGPVSVQSGGTLAPGDGAIGKLTFASTLTLNAGSKAVMEISKLSSSLTNDLASVTGTLTEGGSLVVTNIGTNALVLGDSFKLFNAGTFAGAFSSFTLPPLAANLAWDTSKVATNGTIIVIAPPSITSQPTSQTVYVNSNATFTVTATGTPAPVYQWRFNNANVSGATTSSYTVSIAQVANEGAYTVVLTNTSGSVTSAIATLSLYREFGSAPAPYPSLLASNGARHLIVPGFQLGTTNVATTEARTNSASEDGVSFTSALQIGKPASVQVVASAPGYLNAWIDYMTNGLWSDPLDQVFTNVALVAGTNTLTFAVPASAVVTPGTWARFRFSTATDLSFTGEAPNGEVEDYQVSISSASNPPPVIGNSGFNGSGSFVLSGQASPNQTCILEAATNLIVPIAWSPVATNTADNTGAYSLMDTQATNYLQRFYRVTTP